MIYLNDPSKSAKIAKDLDELVKKFGLDKSPKEINRAKGLRIAHNFANSIV